MISLNINKYFNPFKIMQGRTQTSSGSYITKTIYPDDNLINDVVAIRHHIEERLQILKGELDYNINIGIPIGFNKDSVDLAILDIIKSTYGVINAHFIGDSKLQNGRFYSASIKVSTIYDKDIIVNI